MLTFYYGSGSPYAWRVWLALENKAIAYELKMISFSAGDLRKPEFLKINPRHKVPAITDGNLALYESAAIVEYLDEQYASGRKLIPGNAKQRALIRRLVREADEYFAHAQERQVLRRGWLQWLKPDDGGIVHRPAKAPFDLFWLQGWRRFETKSISVPEHEQDTLHRRDCHRKVMLSVRKVGNGAETLPREH